MAELRTYSTGMVMRLAFAIAIHARPRTFLIDEALSVGDAHFQQKCIGEIRRFRENGGSIVFVSHDLNAVRRATVPPGIGRVTVYLRTGPNTTVRTVRADGRVALHAPAGVEGTATVAVSPRAPTTVRFVPNGSAETATGRFELRYTRLRTRPTTLAVTVDE